MTLIATNNFSVTKHFVTHTKLLVDQQITEISQECKCSMPGFAYYPQTAGGCLLKIAISGSSLVYTCV